MCGSGTLLVEAAQMLAGIPPGLERSFAFEKFHTFKPADWSAIRDAVQPAAVPAEPTIFGSDISGDMLVMARNNLERAGIPFAIPLKQIEAQEIKPPTDMPGLLIANPPYGERIDVRGDSSQEPDELAVAFFSAFGSTLKSRFAGWTVCLFTADLTLPKMLRLKEARKTPFFNGAIECRLFRFEMVAGSNRRDKPQA
jgi:putative N6-adenine-specific DNA methylase